MITLYQRNVKIYKYYSLFINLLIIGPILVPYMLLKGLSYTEIMLLQSISAISVFVFEVPTGVVSDKISRKVSLVLSSLFCSLGLLFYISFNSFIPFAIAEILFGIGMTFHSGADSSILYESLNFLNRKKEYQNIEGHASSLVFTGQALGSILSGFLYKYYHDLPLWISIFNMLIAGVISLKFVEPKSTKSEHKYHLHIFKSFGIIFRTKRLLWTILLAIIVGFTFRASFWLYQPYFKEVKIDVMYFGLIFFVFNMIAAFSSKYLVKKFYETRPRIVLTTLTFFMSCSYLLPFIFRSVFSLIFLSLQQIVRGLYQPTLRFYINHQIEDKYRATIISVISLISSLSFAVFSPLAGLSLDYWGTLPTYFFVGIFSVVGTILLILFRHKQKKNIENVKII